MKKIIFVIVYIISFNSLYCQEELNSLQINILNQTKDAFNLRKTFLLNKIPINYEDSFTKFIIADSLIQDLIKNNPDYIDLKFYDLISESITKELNTSKEDITKLSKGMKSKTKTDDGNYEFTDGERKYYTYLFFVLIKIDDKLKELKTNN